MMATLIVRRLSNDLVQRLKERAAQHGRSSEAEHRAILETALRPPRTGDELWERLRRGERMEIDFERPTDQQVPRPADFE
jgi:plasmid stability protein